MAPTTAAKKTGPTTGIKRVKGENFYRNAKQAARVKLLTGGKPIRDKAGHIVEAAAFQNTDAPSGRVQPDRRWFGNTRVISQDALEHFRTSLVSRKEDPYSVLLKRNKLPMSLLDDSHVGQKRSHIVETEPFKETFGPKAQRKKVRIEVGSFEELSLASKEAAEAQDVKEDAEADARAKEVETSVTDGFAGSSYAAGPTPGPSKPAGSTSHGAMSAVAGAYAPVPEPMFAKGTSRRIFGELYKVIDSSDVIIHVLDARDPLGTLCQNVVDYVRKEKSHKQIVYLINKVDLVPGWVTQRYLSYLTPQAPTLAFHASQTHSFGKGALIQLLRQFSQLHSDRKQISVGLIGYPNVGKSSIINCLKSAKVCNVAPIPGETKVWQYITLMRRIYLIDCPGIVPASKGDSQTDKVLKGVVRIENLVTPSEHIPGLLERVRPVYLERTYGLEGLLESSLRLTARKEDASAAPIPENVKDMRWNADAFLDAIARKSGRLLKGGEADRETVARMVLNDWIRGNIPYFEKPPDSANFLKKVGTEAKGSAAVGGVVIKPKVADHLPGDNVDAMDVGDGIADRDEPGDTEAAAEWDGLGDEGEAAEAEALGDPEEWSHSEDSDDDDDNLDGTEGKAGTSQHMSKKQRKAINKKKREPRPLYVQQDLRGVVTKPKFVSDDRREEDESGEALVMGAEEDIEDEGDAGSDWSDEVPGRGDDEVEADEETEGLKWDDVFSEVPQVSTSDVVASEGQLPSPVKSEKSKGKQKDSGKAPVIPARIKTNGSGISGVEDDEIVKEGRMKTNKRKAENFYTHANVKNRNREKKRPQAPGKLDERGKNGNRKAGGKGGRRK
ncbi:GTPase required for pre-60S ribosomal subunit nuclear export and maturation [Tulasnella sp. JGI-2019a]|nr:GTPase required for pre-60S ribosomal subunit nuclear export and maturation [Tulasnella sp. JGI-2019a]